ncbi:sensor histidine kinase [Dyadobacter psychrotolerans]|uniref:histidine kinase n=1 Tax=Dyadobacter psychrotolerans TaxID=2541721 RepID=A0A4R5DG27_9BACT|nr:sensor histidine kinase [Dyadobacter psychrotolerans]TDE10754.1 sensor histidine kinase [Dyadobacter psychrotolerans]
MRGSIKLGVIAVNITLSLIILSFYNVCHSQSLSDRVVGRYDINKKRLLAISTGMNLFMVGQGQLDLDSAMLLSTRAYKFSRLFPFNEGYDNGAASEGRNLIDSGRISEAERLFNKINGDDRIRLGLDLGTYYLFKPGMNKTDLDQSLKYILQSQKLAALSDKPLWKNESLSLLAKFCAQKGDIAQSQKHFSDVVKANMRAKDKKGIALATANQAINVSVGNPIKLALLEKARPLCRDAGLMEKEVEVLSNIVIEYFITDFNISKAKQAELIKLQNAAGYFHTHIALNAISFIEDVQGDYISSITHASEAVKVMEQTGDTKFAAPFYLRLAQLYFHMDKKEGINLLLKSLKNKSKETQLFWYNSFITCANQMIVFNSPKEALKFLAPVIREYPPTTLYQKMSLAILQGHCHTYLNQPKIAIKFYDLYSTLAENFPAKFAYAEIPSHYLNIAMFYASLGNQAKTKWYVEKAKPFLSGTGSVFNRSKIDFINFKLDSLNGNYVSAIKNYQKFKLTSDSLLNLSSVRQMNFMQVQFETKNKDQNIKLLTQQGELQKARLKEGDFIRNMTFGGILLLLVIVGLLYNQYRVKQRSNEQLQTKQDEISRKNSSLENLLEEKEWLLKEVHHRVKNNLHTIMSLLESQSAYLSDDALLAIHDSQHRIHAMSLIHQKLYTSEDVTTIEMSSYIQELASYLRDSFIHGQDIRFQLDVDPIELDVAQAIPLGLILNEAITNSLKYAFPGNRTGLICITFKQVNDQLFKLSVADNGIGLKPNFNTEKVSSLGMKLMRGLSNEIHADLQILSEHGTTISLTFSSKRVVTGQQMFSLNQS